MIMQSYIIMFLHNFLYACEIQHCIHGKDPRLKSLQLIL